MDRTWNAGIEAAKAANGLTAGEAWDAWLDTDEAIKLYLPYSVADLARAQRNFMHAFELKGQQNG